MQTTNCTDSTQSNPEKFPRSALLPELPQLRFLVLVQRLDSLLFDKKINAFSPAGQRQPVQAGGQFRRRIEIVVARYIYRSQLAEMAALVVVTPAFQ